MRVSLAKSDRSFSADPERPLLDSALGAGLKLAHSCRGGSCGACRARLLRGEVRYPNGRPLGLSEADIGEGLILLCQARAAGDLCIETVELATSVSAVIKRLPARIDRVDAWSPQVRGVYLRLPAAEPFQFLPGQYLDILLSGGRRRSFSIASPPHDSRLLELHVRRVPGGEFTEPLFAGDAAGSLLSIEGPLGRFVYRAADRPMLLIGGGTGLAPLKSILRHVIEGGLDRDLTLYWGVRTRHDLYAGAELQELARRTARFQYHPVLSEPPASWTGRRGAVHEAVLGDVERFEGLDIYASGPPAMVEAVRAHVVRRGADPRRLFADVFDYAPDSLSRHRMSAASKS